eukprot:TRINITY_DN3_c1_g1_i4.p7 TRINITY_DN3_c1_g1~~TRINITY_DN3_c1_g1_i4.p7  ORF type:complete len:191 (-),score=15.45 TRINITY_DN3_c1_g1_i4:178-750(-)
MIPFIGAASNFYYFILKRLNLVCQSNSSKDQSQCYGLFLNQIYGQEPRLTSFKKLVIKTALLTGMISPSLEKMFVRAWMNNQEGEFEEFGEWFLNLGVFDLVICFLPVDQLINLGDIYALIFQCQKINGRAIILQPNASETDSLFLDFGIDDCVNIDYEIPIFQNDLGNKNVKSAKIFSFIKIKELQQIY